MEEKSNKKADNGEESSARNEGLRPAKQTARPPYYDANNLLIRPDGLTMCEPEWFMLNEKLESTRAQRGLSQISSLSNKNAASYASWSKDIRQFLDLTEQEISDQYFYRFKYDIPKNNYVGKSNRDNVILDRNRLYAYIFQDSAYTRDRYINEHKKEWAEWYPESEIAKEILKTGSVQGTTTLDIDSNSQNLEKRTTFLKEIAPPKPSSTSWWEKNRWHIIAGVILFLLAFRLGMLFNSQTDNDPFQLKGKWNYNVYHDGSELMFGYTSTKRDSIERLVKYIKGSVNFYPFPWEDVSGQREYIIRAKNGIEDTSKVADKLIIEQLFMNPKKKEVSFYFTVKGEEGSQGFVIFNGVEPETKSMKQGKIFYLYQNHQWYEETIDFDKQPLE